MPLGGGEIVGPELRAREAVADAVEQGQRRLEVGPCVLERPRVPLGSRPEGTQPCLPQGKPNLLGKRERPGKAVDRSICSANPRVRLAEVAQLIERTRVGDVDALARSIQIPDGGISIAEVRKC